MNSWFLATVFLGSLLLGAAAVSWSIRLAHRWGKFDHPDGGRKTQPTPIPKLGGLAVAVAFSVAAFTAIPLVGDSIRLLEVLAIVLPALLAAILGYLDDVRPLSPRVRLIFQSGIGVLVWILGTRISAFGQDWVDFAATVVWVLVIVNGINLLDNSDGLAGVTVYISAAGAVCVALLFGQDLVAPLAVAVCGVSAGFLVHNWYPARVYLGDAGAYFLGVLLATVIIRLRPSGIEGWSGVAVGLLLVLLPLVDTTYVVIRRMRAGVHPFTAGKDHLSHQLQARGLSVPASVLALGLGSLLSTMAGVLLAFLLASLS